MSSLIQLPFDIQFERLFEDAFNPRICAYPSSVRVGRSASTNPTQSVDSFRPRMDLEESKDANTVVATFELPGLNRENVTIDLQENRLTVSGESSASSTSRSDEWDGHVVRERRYGKFSRTLRLPFGTKPEDVNAKLENGLLTVTFPKTTSGQGPQRIAIQQ